MIDIRYRQDEMARRSGLLAVDDLHTLYWEERCDPQREVRRHTAPR